MALPVQFLRQMAAAIPRIEWYQCRLLAFTKTNTMTILNNNVPAITHVIFDFDGVIQDTERIYYEADDYALQHYGNGRRFNNFFKQGMMGRTAQDGIQWLLKVTNLNDKVTWQEYNELYERRSKELYPTAKTMPGVKTLVHHLVDNGIQIAICTSSDEEEFQTKAPQSSDVVPLFPLVVKCASDPAVKRGKPAPDPYLVTMKRFKVPPVAPHNVLVFEDSANGARAAAAAGCTVVFVPQPEYKTPDWDKSVVDLKPKVAEIIDSIADFVPEKYGMPAIC